MGIEGLARQFFRHELHVIDVLLAPADLPPEQANPSDNQCDTQERELQPRMGVIAPIQNDCAQYPADQQHGLEFFTARGGKLLLSGHRIAFALQGMFNGFAHIARNPVFWRSYQGELCDTPLT